jgi:UDPglucose 6-dehydrogenase
MKKVAMIGVGKLGQDCAQVMAKHYDVIGYDIEPKNIIAFPMVKTIEEAVKDRDLIFIAAPTPHDPMYGGETPTSHLPNKDFDYTIVTEILKEVNKYANQKQLVVLISTVLPGTVRNQLRPCITNARFIYNPYLIAMGTVKWDMVNPEMVIIGTEDGSVTGDAQELIEFYKVFMENDPRYEIGTWDEAESIKIFYNTFISTKLALVNMIQDVAEKNGNINVDVVTKALADSKYRIMGPAYMKAGLGDAGACHPRDNIALRWLAEKLDLGYDLFDAIMTAREKQAEQMALRCLKNGKNVTIVGKAYKPKVHYTNGSASMLVGYYIEKHGGTVNYYDVHTGDNNLKEFWTDVYLIGYWDDYVERINFPRWTTVIDPWRKLTDKNHYGEIIHYGDTRTAPQYKVDESQINSHTKQIVELYPEIHDLYYKYPNTVHIIYAGINKDHTFRLRPFEDIVQEIEEVLDNHNQKYSTDSNIKLKILFDGQSEDFIADVLSKIHRITKHFEGRIPYKDFIYLCGADSIDKDYDDLMNKHDWKEKITVLSTRYFEWIAQRNSQEFQFLGGYIVESKPKKFLCFNKNPRKHRKMLLEKMLENNLISQSYYSFEGDEFWLNKIITGTEQVDEVEKSSNKMAQKLAEIEKSKIDRANYYPQIYKNKDIFPLRLNITPARNNPTDIRHDDLKYFNESLFSIVTETLFFTKPAAGSGELTGTSIFFSEKIWKSIILQHPFILLARPGSLKKLKELGYKTFSPFIDERYDDILDDQQRFDFIIEEIKRLCNMDLIETENWQKNIKSIVEFNKLHFFENKKYTYNQNVLELINEKLEHTENIPEEKINNNIWENFQAPALVDINDGELAVIPTDSIPLKADNCTSVTLNSNIKIDYNRVFDGGGLSFKDHLIEIIKRKRLHNKVYSRAFEWCAGFGVLGYEILGMGICNHIVFSDYYDKAIQNCQETALKNYITAHVTTYVSPTIAGIPENEVWDLVVSNPPHVESYEEFIYNTINQPQHTTAPDMFNNSARLCVDEGFAIHKEFFKNIKKHLTPDADIYLIENNDYEIFKEYAKHNGLKHIESIPLNDPDNLMLHGTVMHFKVNNDTN